MPFGPFARTSIGPQIPRARRIAAPRVEALDPRQLMAVASPSVVMLGVTTIDSRSVTITYDVEAPQSVPITLGVYRSADSTFSAGDVPVGPVLRLPAVDSAGNSLAAVGTHTVTVPLTNGLPLNPEHPYVVAVTDPTSTGTTGNDAPSAASFRTYSIGVVTHGGIQYGKWKTSGIPWANQMAGELLAEGYDAAIPFNWVAQSRTPGAAAKQAPRLERMILDAAAKFPAGSPVDVHFIGHSEGAVVNTQAIIGLTPQQTSGLKAGYWEDTLLDPHAANPDFPGRQYSVASGLLGAIAKVTIDNYQARARDPLVTIPDRVDASQVFYQQNPANKDHNENGGIYNLWGDVPIPGASTYFNLTPAGIVHGGDNGVYAWYNLHVVPILGNGDAGLYQVAVSGAAVPATTATASAATTTTTTATGTPAAPKATVPATDPSLPTFRGRANPGATVFLRAGHPGSPSLQTVAETVAGADGTWTAQVAGLAPGKYRVLADTKVTGPIAGKRPVIATTPLGSITVAKA